MVTKSYSKPSGFLRSTKRSFFDDNAKHLAETRRLADVYVVQPLRVSCMACDRPLEGADFEKGGIRYIFCARCGHVNGAHQDTPAYCAAVYGSDELVSAYAGDAEAYCKRVEDVYLPKANHLIQSLRAEGELPDELSYADIGAGAGHFLAALRDLGIKRVKGCEISKGLCAIANAQLGERLMIEGDASGMLGGVDVATMIHALEHLPDPRGMIAKIRATDSVRYVYIAIPLFSPAVYFETAFPDAFPRHLSSGHTHLFTLSSLDRFCQEFGLNRRAEWWFGADAMDLFRMIGLRQNGALIEKWSEDFAKIVDPLQAALDHERMSSEIHFLAEVIR